MCHSCIKFLNAIIIFDRIYAYNASKINLQARESIQESLSKSRRDSKQSQKREEKMMTVDHATSL